MYRQVPSDAYSCNHSAYVFQKRNVIKFQFLSECWLATCQNSEILNDHSFCMYPYPK